MGGHYPSAQPGRFSVPQGKPPRRHPEVGGGEGAPSRKALFFVVQQLVTPLPVVLVGGQEILANQFRSGLVIRIGASMTAQKKRARVGSQATRGADPLSDDTEKLEKARVLFGLFA
jgi:hypothetical protein